MVAVPEALFTAGEYGPVLAVAVWDARYENPLYLVTNLSEADTVVEYYRLRFRMNVSSQIPKPVGSGWIKAI